MNNAQLVELTADIVTAHVSNNSVAIRDVAELLQRVHGALSSLGPTVPEPEEERKTPAVSIRASIKPDYLTCLVCGRRQKTLRRHLMGSHNMTPEQYRSEYGLRLDYPITAPNYSERRRAMAKAIGLGRKKGESPKPGPSVAKPATAGDSGKPSSTKRRGRKSAVQS